MLRLNHHNELLVLLCLWVARRCHAVFEEIEATPSNTLAFQLGELSLPQFLVIIIVFFKLTLLYAVGVLPLEIDLVGIFDPIRDMMSGRSSGSNKLVSKQVFISSLTVDCPFQYLCELDFWAHRPQEHFIEDLIASWLRNPNATWTDPKAKTFAGTGTCPEMYPCPFDVQKVVGIPIPGSCSANQQVDRVADLEMKFL